MLWQFDQIPQTPGLVGFEPQPHRARRRVEEPRRAQRERLSAEAQAMTASSKLPGVGGA